MHRIQKFTVAFSAGFHSSDRRLYSEKSGHDFANEYNYIRVSNQLSIATEYPM